MKITSGADLLSWRVENQVYQFDLAYLFNLFEKSRSFSEAVEPRQHWTRHHICLLEGGRIKLPSWINDFAEAPIPRNRITKYAPN